MFLKNIWISGLSLGLLTCTAEQSPTQTPPRSSYYERVIDGPQLEASGTVTGFTYDVESSNAGEFSVKLYPLTEASGVDPSSPETYISGYWSNKGRRWILIYLCGDQRLFGRTGPGCDVVQPYSEQEWIYLPCDLEGCVTELRRRIPHQDVQSVLSVLASALEQVAEHAIVMNA